MLTPSHQGLREGPGANPPVQTTPVETRRKWADGMVLLGVGALGHADSRLAGHYPRDTISYHKWWRGRGIVANAIQRLFKLISRQITPHPSQGTGPLGGVLDQQPVSVRFPRKIADRLNPLFLSHNANKWLAWISLNACKLLDLLVCHR
jgi:hypothetical protein